MFSRFIHVANFIPFYDQTIFHSMVIPHFLIHSSINDDQLTFWILLIKLLWTFVHRFLCRRRFSILLGIYLRVDLPARSTFFANACDIICKKPLTNPRSWRFTATFSFKSFIVLAVTFKSLVHFKLIFLYHMKWESTFNLLHIDIQLSLHYLLKRLFFSLIELLWYSYWKPIDYKHEGLFLDSQFYCICLSLSQYHTVLIIFFFFFHFESRKCEASNSVFLFQHYFRYSGSLEYPY